MANIREQLLQPEEGWIRIDNTDSKIVYNGNWANDNLVLEGVDYYNHTISYTNNKDDSLDFYFYGSKLRIIDAITPNRSQITKIFIDEIEYQYSTYNEVKILKPILVFEIDGLRNGAHKVTISNTDSLFIALDAIDIDGRILSLIEYDMLVNKHLIKSNGKYYTIENNELVEITEPITHQLIKNIGVSASTLTEKQSLLPDKFKLISHRDNTFDIRAVKSYKELVVASSDFNTTVQSNIDFFDVVGITDTGTSIKVAFSIDGGVTWKTYDTEFKDLSITIPSKPYNELTVEELNQWNNARDIISEQGIDIANLSKINFNTLNMKKIRFAYVLSINSKDNKCCTSQLKWQFDSKGTMKSMTSDELEIELLQDSIKIVPKVSSDMIKINFTNGINVNVEGLSVSYKVLFDGKADTGLVSYELADNINNYDFVSITSMTSDDGTTKNITLPVSILDKVMSKTQPISLESYYAPTNGAHMYVIRFRLQNNTLLITDIQYKGWSDCYICSIIGIKCSKESSNLDINSLTDEQISTLKVRLGI